jgi:NADPH:quinone reductase-like Zn-dependent oxidoreductase
MKAIVYEKYGSPDVLKLQEVDKPIPEDDEVLVEVTTASINSWDGDFLKGALLARPLAGFLRPKHKILGTDVAGRVEAIGSKVTRFNVGDEVFGEVSKRLLSIGWGGLAEFVCAREGSMLKKPAELTFEQAAALPQVGALALGAIRYNGEIQPGQKVLINGAGGGVGTLAMQIAKSFGAEVTGVDSADKLEVVRSLGADHVIDYAQEDFTKNGERYDLIIDVAASRSTFDYKRALSPKGAYGVIGGSQARFFQTVFLGRFISMLGGKKMGAVGADPNEGLEFLVELIQAGKVVPVIDKRFTLSETADAFRYFQEGTFVGKIVITM